ncbi:MAG TPA: M23 family metallopeptidase [Burkholderiaceae bacterium]|nr:M23 family metallopeptidase [Burkholderiaceae bacterium]
MMPDASDLPKHLVTENVTSEDIQSQLDALAEHALQLYRTDLTRSSDTADTLLKRLNVSDAAAADFLRTDPVARALLTGHGGKMVQVQTDENGALTELVARYAATDAALQDTHFTRLSITRSGDKFHASTETAALASQVRIGSGTVRSSLYAATDDARIPDSVANQIAEVFANDIDFRRELRRGDTFSVVYEALTADGEPITWGSSAGKLMAAEFVNDGHTYSAVWFKDAQGKGAYYDFDGNGKKRAFLASPVAYSRVTSGFSMRKHPILGIWKQHKGVDLAAPTGTPVHAVGDGVVDFAGTQHGYGKVVEIRHGHDRSTLYAHLSRIYVKRGEHVDQGERVGAVGMTGWATGPHLHFEVKVHGVQHDPIAMAKSSAAITLSPAAKARFAQFAQVVKGQLEVADGVKSYSVYSE